MLCARELVSRLLLYLLLILLCHKACPILNYFISLLITALHLFLKLYHANNWFLNSVRRFFAILNWIKAGIEHTYLPTLPVFPGVSKFFIKSPGLPVRAPNLPDKMDFYKALLCYSLKFSPIFHKIRTFCIHCTVSGTFLHMFSQWQRLVRHYNDESAFWFHVLHVRRHIMS